MEKLTIDKECNAVKALFDDYIKEDDFKKLANGLLSKVQSSGIKKLIQDTSNLKVMTPGIQEWIKESWFPKANQLGVSHMAFVVPNNVFGQVSMEETNKDQQKVGNIEIKYFNTLNSAKEWIKTV